MVEFSPATRVVRVRFPADAIYRIIFIAIIYFDACLLLNSSINA